MGHLYLSSLSASEQVLHSLKEEMAPKNVILQSPKKETIGSTSEGSTKASIAFGNRSTKMVTRSMTKAATSITLKQQIVALSLQSRKTQNFSFNLPAERANQTACLPNSKLKTLAIFNIRKVLPCGLEEFQTYINPIFRPFSEEADDHGTTKKVVFTNMDSSVAISTFSVGKTLYQQILICC